MGERPIPFVAGRFGRTVATPGLRVRELTHAALASVVARRAQDAAASAAAERAFGCALPDRPLAVAGRDVTFLGSGPGQWLAVAASATTDIESRLGAPFAGVATVVDQSDGRLMFELEGPRVRDVMAKGFSIDFDPRAFRTGVTAITRVAHLDVQLWQVADEPRYRILVVRSYFGSFWRWLASSAAEFGGEVLESQRYRHAQY